MTNTIVSSGEELNLQQIASGFQVAHATPSRLRLRTKDMSCKTAVKTFAQILRQQEGVGEVQFNEKTGSLVVTFDRHKLSQTQILALIQKLGVSQVPAPEEKKTDYFAAWKSADFWKEQGLDLIPLATGLAVTSGLGISGLAAIPLYMFTAEATRQAIDLTRDAWLEVKDERVEEKSEDIRLKSEVRSQNTPYKIVHAVPGRVRLNVPRLSEDPVYAERLQKLLKADAAIASFRLNRDAASIAINYKLSEAITASYWLDLLQVAETESSQPNSRATAPIEQKTEIDSQPIVSPDTSESEIDITLLPDSEKLKATETTNSWTVMKSPALNVSLAFMANFPLQTVPE